MEEALHSTPNDWYMYIKTTSNIQWSRQFEWTNVQIEKEVLTFGPHADREALFQSALLALSPHVHVYVAAIAVFALVDGILRYAAPEESCGGNLRKKYNNFIT